MPVKAERVTGGNPLVQRGAETTGISVLFVPDETFYVLSNEAAKRNMTVAQLVEKAVRVYLEGTPEAGVPDTAEMEQPTREQSAPRRTAPVLKGYR